MRRCSYMLPFACASRFITLRPESLSYTDEYPLGYVPLDGTETIDSVYALVKHGYFVAPLSRIETIHNVHMGVGALSRSEYPVVSAQDIITSFLKEREVLSRILIRRDFWVLEDFNDPELNSSYGIQNLYFDNYKWSQVLWKRFQMFVEEYFPIVDHTHLLYSEYMQLIKSFSVFEQGARALPLLPKSVKLHPPFGVPSPSKFFLEPLVLLKRWLTNFRAVLMIHSAIVLNVGCGASAFSVKMANVPMVRGVDPSPRVVAACRSDAARFKAFSGVSFQVAEMFPPRGEVSHSVRRGYDLIVYYPDQKLMSMLTSDGSDFTPSCSSFTDSMESFFENAREHISESGVIAIVCTNLFSLIYPNTPNPIEYEVKVNRRYVILDYYDVPLRHVGSIGLQTSDPRLRYVREIRSKLRSELWVLHKVESLQHFGFLHGIPGAKPPPTARNWCRGRMSSQRRRLLREHVNLLGDNWGDYKSRLMSMLRESSDASEDDVAEAVRMALDPTFPRELEARARDAVRANLAAEEEFHRGVFAEYSDVSPREAFDLRKY